MSMGQEGQGPPDISAFMPVQETTAEETQSQETEGQAESSLSDGFLANIPDKDRAIVSRYVKDWDAGVTKRFQEIHDSYSPYKELGEVDQLKQALELYQMVDTQPEVVYEALKQHFEQQGAPNAFQPPPNQGVPNQFPQNGQFPQQPQQMNPQLQQALSPFLTPLQEQLATQQQLMAQMADVIVKGHQSTQEQQEDAALDGYLDELRQKHGDFPEDVILLHLYQNPGSTGDQAIAAWKSSMQQFFPSTQPPPPVLTGGSVPQQTVDVGSMDSKDVRSLVANVMAATQNQ
jgi:hypothetical protein